MPFVSRMTVRAAAILGGVVVSASLAFAQSAPDVSALALPVPTASAPAPAGAPTGQVQIVIRLTDPPLAAAVGANAKRNGTMWSAAQQSAYLAQLKAKQDAVMAGVSALGGQEIARVSKAHNAVVAQIDALRIREVAKLAGVSKIRPVVDYQLDLTDTVPYIGAKALQLAGLDGAGVRVAVLDSGIDYTHRNLGGAGTAAAYAAAWGTSAASPLNKTLDGLFPTAKVIGGYDFVGEVWPNGSLQPDPDPIAAPGAGAGIGTDGSHGTHVSDIIAGKSNDGLHVGVAPGASLYAVKICSAVATSCSGVALLQGVDFAMDPNGDNDISDAVDIMNLSLGSSYGQREDDLSEAVANASRFGVVVVVSAGNSADRPYIAGSPSTTPEVISVAQTQVPSAFAVPLVVNSPASIAGVYGNTATVDWAPIVAGFTGIVRRAGATGTANAIACTAATTIDFTGVVALIDRGTCAVSIKVANAAANGAIGVLIANNVAGDAPTFSFGGGSPLVQTLILSQATGNVLKTVATNTANVTVSLATKIPLAGSMASTSSRGPGYSYTHIKPEIGAPGASLSAESGTGTGETVFGGTSGAAPMVAGSAALLLQAFPTASANEIKARLMNSAEIAVYTNPATLPGELAPITRIGAGEVRVDRARALTAGAWDAVDPASVGLSFGYNASTGVQMLNKKVVVRNYAAGSRTFAIAPSFRFAADQASGAVIISAPASITVPGNGASSFVVSMRLTAANLPAWTLGASSNQGTGPLLTAVEYDGYVTISDATDTVRLPWHILPHKADNLKAAPTTVALGGGPSGSTTLSNLGGAVTGRGDVFALTGTSSRIPAADLPKPGDNFAIIDLKAVGARAVSVGGGAFGIQVAINTYGARSMPVYPAEFDVYIDSNNDGIFDYVMYTSENGTFASSGQTVVNVINLATNAVVTRYFADADVNSSNMIMTANLSDLGMTLGSKFRYSVYAFDNYFTGALTDYIEDMVMTLGTPRFGTDAAGSLPSFTLPANGSGPLPVAKVAGGDAASPSQTGLLLMYRDAKPGLEADAITVTP